MGSQAKSRRGKGKLRVGVIFGGRSAEHQVSLVSAASIIRALDKRKYQVIPIGITSEGKWISSAQTLQLLRDGKRGNSSSEKILLPDPTRQSLLALGAQSRREISERIDVIFPVLHGTYGEDGTVQGLFELTGIPYVGAGVLGSATGMDKIVTKQLCERQGIPVTPYLWFLGSEFRKQQSRIVGRILKKVGLPCFVKPSNMGSSVGISKVQNPAELLEAIRLAATYDRRILVEKAIERAREIEVSVLGNDDPIASVPGEIISSNEFYDYNAKYVDGASKAVVPAKLPGVVVRQLKDYAVRTFKAIDCSGMGRVDFLVAASSKKIYMNEINTIPGFTSISMFPKLWEASGIPYPKLLDRLIELAIERHRERQSLRTTFSPRVEWYKGG